MTDRFTTTRGLPQGAPESPLVFTILCDYVLAPLIAKWRNGREDTEGGSDAAAAHKGFSTDSFWWGALAYADDILLSASTKEALEEMIDEVTVAFKAAGLGIGHDKTNWTCWPLPAEDEVLRAAQHQVKAVQEFTFVGVAVTLRQPTATSMTHRKIQAQKCLGRWRSLRRCQWLAPKRRCQLLQKSVLPAFLWGAQCWAPTAQQESSMQAWGARLTASVAGVRRHPEETDHCWWRRMHRAGHQLMKEFKVEPAAAQRRRLHQWAGHLARRPCHHSGSHDESDVAAHATRARSLQRWRWLQNNGKKTDWIHWGFSPKKMHGMAVGGLP